MNSLALLQGLSNPAPIHILYAVACTSGPILSEYEQKQYFAGCTLIGPENRILGPRGIFYKPDAFNSTFGGKLFINSPDGKTTNKAWEAATNNPMGTILKVDGIRFLPMQPPGELTADGIGRTYLNTYVPEYIETTSGADVSPFLRHLELLLPIEKDREILLRYMAHCVKYPGHKIGWAPLIQSTEGAGKNVFKEIMQHAIGRQYFYQPNAKKFAESGNRFNGWMENKLFILVDEIKVDERRDMVEKLKDWITESELEVEGKGIDQKMKDTPFNWLFFSNHKNAIPISKNGRRYAIFYSSIQSDHDLCARGMDKRYFDNLYNWLGGERNGNHRTGIMAVAGWLLEYPLSRGNIESRAPATSSHEEALIESRGWLETLIMDAVADELDGFKRGWISTAALGRVLRDNVRAASTQTIGTALKSLGYTRIGQTSPHYRDDPHNPNKRTVLWNLSPNASKGDYGTAQGYGEKAQILGQTESQMPGLLTPRH